MRIKIFYATNKRARTSTPPEINVWLTTPPDSHSVTTSDSWLSRYMYLIVDWTLGTLQALVHYVTVTVKKNSQIEQTAKIYQHQKIFMQIIFIVKISRSLVLQSHDPTYFTTHKLDKPHACLVPGPSTPFRVRVCGLGMRLSSLAVQHEASWGLGMRGQSLPFPQDT